MLGRFRRDITRAACLSERTFRYNCRLPKSLHSYGAFPPASHCRLFRNTLRVKRQADSSHFNLAKLMKDKSKAASVASTMSGGFAERVRLLIQRAGSATEIARMCGFSEGVVRSWRDGNSDPSRARCVTLAKTLGVSLVWLVAGEGMMQVDTTASNDEQTSSHVDAAGSRRMRAETMANSSQPSDAVVDTTRLNTAINILQSELELSRSSLSLVENSDLLSSLYAALGPGGKSVDTAAMLSFNRQLSARIRENSRMLA